MGKQGRCIVADGALSICAGNVYGHPRVCDIFYELGNALQARLDHGGGVSCGSIDGGR